MEKEEDPERERKIVVCIFHGVLHTVSSVVSVRNVSGDVWVIFSQQQEKPKKITNDALAIQMISRAVCPAHTRQDTLRISLPFILI